VRGEGIGIWVRESEIGGWVQQRGKVRGLSDLSVTWKMDSTERRRIQLPVIVPETVVPFFNSIVTDSLFNFI
jgi:hypothetical protein